MVLLLAESNNGGGVKRVGRGGKKKISAVLATVEVF